MPVQCRRNLGATRQVDVAIGRIHGRAMEHPVTLHLLQLRSRHDLVGDPIRHASHALPNPTRSPSALPILTHYPATLNVSSSPIRLSVEGEGGASSPFE